MFSAHRCVCVFFFSSLSDAELKRRRKSEVVVVGGGNAHRAQRGWDAGADACRLEREAAADCRKNGSEEEGKSGASSREKRGEIQRAARRGAIKEYDGNKSL